MLNKCLLVCFSLLFCFTNSYAQNEHAKSLGLNIENGSDLAVYMMLYQIGLKDKTQNILGSESCISVTRDSVGNTSLSFGVKTDAFITGTVDFSQDDGSKYKLINGTLSQLFDFFKEAKYNPKISVRSYADPQHNIMKKYSEGSTFSKKYSKALFDENSKNDLRFDNESKRRNYLLAYDRGESFIQKYFPEDMKDKVRPTPFHSPDLEVGNNQDNSEQYACPDRRTIVVDMMFNPNLKIESSPGAFTPSFEVASGVSNHENILATIFDAKNKKLSDLPEYCQNESSKEFIEASKLRYNNLKRLMHQGNIQTLQAAANEHLQDERIEYDCRRRANDFFEECVELKKNLKKYFVAYSEHSSDENLYNLISALTVTEDHKRMRVIRNLCYSSNRYCNSYKNIVNKIGDASTAVYLKGKKQNSSHFLDCFSNGLFYAKQLKENTSDYITPVIDLRDPETGELTISYGEENVPNTSKGKGFLCQACGNGLKLHNGSFEYLHRAKSRDHEEYHHKDSIKTYESLHANTDNKTMFMVGHQKGLSVYIVKDCKLESLNEIAANSRMVNLQDLKSKKLKVGPNDCIFKPKIINSCVHMPQGAGTGDENKMSYISRVPSMLTGKNLELALEAEAIMVDAIFKGLKDDYINTCHFNGEVLKKVQDDPKNVIDDILCKNRGIHLPKASFDAASDCPEVVKKIGIQ